MNQSPPSGPTRVQRGSEPQLRALVRINALPSLGRKEVPLPRRPSIAVEGQSLPRLLQDQMPGLLREGQEVLGRVMVCERGSIGVDLEENEARRVRLGNAIILRGRDAPIEDEDVCAVYKGELVAIGDIKQGQFQPRRVLVA